MKRESHTLDEAIALNADHHRRMTRNAKRFVQDGRQNAIDEGDADGYRLMLQSIPSTHRWPILELGAAAGRHFPLLRQFSGQHVWGLEIYEPMAEAGRKRGLDIKTGSLEAIPFGENAFNCIVSRHVMEHTYDLDAALAQFERVLRPGGFVAQATPHYFPDPEPAHICQLDIADWMQTYEEAGWIVNTAYISYFNCQECQLIAHTPEVRR